MQTERNNNKTSSCPDYLMPTAKSKDQPHLVGTHYSTSAIKPSLGLDCFPTNWEQLQTTVTLAAAPTASDSLSQRAAELPCPAGMGKGRTQSSRKGMPEQGTPLLLIVEQGKAGAEPSAEPRLLSLALTPSCH